MHFDLTEEQWEIKRTARAVLAARATPGKVREAADNGRYDDALWDELVGLGWPGIAIAEEYGGQGLGIVELAILLEELGYALAPSPLLPSALAALVLQHAGSGEQRARWLPGLASGEVRGALGTAALVPDAADADVIVLVDDGNARVLERGAATVEPEESIDSTRTFARVHGDGEPLPGDEGGAVDRTTVAIAAEVVGVSQRALDMTVSYVKDRRQFGTPVGAFQAISHRCSQMLLMVEGARSATYFAAWAADAAPGRLAEGAALAGAATAEAGPEVTASAIQAHGGIGFTWEADVHLLYKRALLDKLLLGGVRPHRAKLARLAASRVARRQLTATGSS